MNRSRLALVVLSVVLAAGCSRQFKASAVQPNPLKTPAETLYQSERLIIDLKDMDLADMLLRNTAYFNVVSRDRLRFHVTVEHKWEDHANVETWEVFLEDDQGRRYKPQSKERRKNKHRSWIMDMDRRSTITNAFGDITQVVYDPHRYRATMASVDKYHGEGDYVFFGPDIFNPDLRSLSLVMKRDGVVLRYEWHFADRPGVEVRHYTQRTSEIPTPSEGTVVVPGRLTGHK